MYAKYLVECLVWAEQRMELYAEEYFQRATRIQVIS